MLERRRVSNITPRFLTLPSIFFTVSSIVIWNVSVRLLKFGVEKKMHWALFEFVFKPFSLSPFFHCFRLVSAYIFNCSRLLGLPLNKSCTSSASMVILVVIFGNELILGMSGLSTTAHNIQPMNHVHLCENFNKKAYNYWYNITEWYYNKIWIM